VWISAKLPVGVSTDPRVLVPPGPGAAVQENYQMFLTMPADLADMLPLVGLQSVSAELE